MRQRRFLIFLQVLRYLKTVVRSDVPIKVRRIALKNHDGLCENKGSYFLIKIDRKLPENYAIDVLIHEIAHVDSWDCDQDVHGKTWGLTYARLYRLVLKKFF